MPSSETLLTTYKIIPRHDPKYHNSKDGHDSQLGIETWYSYWTNVSFLKSILLHVIGIHICENYKFIIKTSIIHEISGISRIRYTGRNTKTFFYLTPWRGETKTEISHTKEEDVRINLGWTAWKQAQEMWAWIWFRVLIAGHVTQRRHSYLVGSYIFTKTCYPGVFRGIPQYNRRNADTIR